MGKVPHSFLGIQDTECASQAGDSIIVKSTEGCQNLHEPAYGFDFQFAQHKGDDTPWSRHCKLSLFEQEWCTGRVDEDINDMAWMVDCYVATITMIPTYYPSDWVDAAAFVGIHEASA
ncbi:hypothetical protein LTR17_001476 [Elasticomyces elasticus]|nr:hypothetical protein LTR17_001476 [Elasticomyces elasticus]